MGEACDDGNVVDGDGCDSTARRRTGSSRPVMRRWKQQGGTARALSKEAWAGAPGGGGQGAAAAAGTGGGGAAASRAPEAAAAMAARAQGGVEAGRGGRQRGEAGATSGTTTTSSTRRPVAQAVIRRPGAWSPVGTSLCARWCSRSARGSRRSGRRRFAKGQ
ncbi:MAG: hypothetical protein U0359_03720 [Byssovorax sp.]